MKTLEVKQLPEDLNNETVYKLITVLNPDGFYERRTNRNIGIINKKDQQLLKQKIIGIAGCGGMGGYVAESLLRLGIGELRIADSETFDESNLNRQSSSTMKGIGKSKAFETASRLRSIANDTTIVVYPMGINAETAKSFASGCDLIIDEIELWELAAPIILHQAARQFNVPILGANTCIFGVHLFKFTPSSLKIEEALGVTLSEATVIDEKRRTGSISKKENENLVDKLLLIVTPELKNYNPVEYSIVKERLLTEGKASIISTNPLFAAGFLGDQILIHLLPTLQQNKPVLPSMPGYVYIDARAFEVKIVRQKWF